MARIDLRPLHLMIDAIPIEDGGWTQELRGRWLRALELMVDWAMPVREEGAGEPAQEGQA